MAGNLVLGEFSFASGGSARFEVDYDDSLRVLTFRCVNTGTQNAFGKLVGQDASGVESNTAVYGQSFEPGTSVIAVDLSPANRAITLAASASHPGRYSGYGFSSQVPG